MMLAVLAVLLVSTAVAAASSHPHPLDPPSAAELTAVRAAVLASPLVPARPLYFHYVGLDEPEKPEVLSYASGAGAGASTAPPPAARARHRSSRWPVPRALRRRHRRLRAVRPLARRPPRRGLPDDDDGGPGRGNGAAARAPSLRGLRAAARAERQRRRLRGDLQGVVRRRPAVLRRRQGGDGEDAVLRDRRVDQLLRAAAGGRDAGGGRVAIVGYRDRVVEPVPKAEGTDYRAEKLGPPFTGPATAPGVVVQPEGSGFHIDGRVVRYSVTSTAVRDRIIVDEWTEPTPLVIYMFLLYYYCYLLRIHAKTTDSVTAGARTGSSVRGHHVLHQHASCVD
ncbi:unnamed protein product [Miscanthus lutarioriparius]|uniref:Amine oxidase n=1 Tax=Miscanthus lutarioriparius TaxID=422564 RepID=A0A811SN59_9POAL|nr:unnamed protein product [Miscanthus lutarioriparius]